MEREPAVWTYATAAQEALSNRETALRKKQELASKPGGVNAFLSGVTIAPIDVEKELQTYHDVLASGILPEELVGVEVFRDIMLNLNNEQLFQDALGPSRYFTLGVKDPEGKMIGAIGMAVFCHKEGPATIHGSFHVLLPEYRALGIGNRMMDAVPQVAANYIASQEGRPGALAAGKVIHFIETNDIKSMTVADSLMDRVMAMHPIVRDEHWERKGFRELDGIDYVLREDPPIPMALKAMEIRVSTGNGGLLDIKQAPPEFVAASTVAAHVRALDTWIMTTETSRESLLQGRPLNDPIADALIKSPIGGGDFYFVVPLQKAQTRRAYWERIDKKIGDLPPEQVRHHMSKQFCELTALAGGTFPRHTQRPTL